jgi:hypothetical protein
VSDAGSRCSCSRSRSERWRAWRPPRRTRPTTAPRRGARSSSAVFAYGSALTHPTPAGAETLSSPDDITALGDHIFVGFQNGVGPQGEASPTGNRDSTVVEFDLDGHAIAQWDVVGKCDGLTADPATGRVIATVNEDANSSMYRIDPVAGARPVHFRYASPLESRGGTDAISVDHGMVLVSGSAPGTTGTPAPNAAYPAAYGATFDNATHVVRLGTLFTDEAPATVANTNSPDKGKVVRLALTDPDSNEVVPSYAARFAGDFMLMSQGDREQVFLAGVGCAHPTLSVLKLTDSVDDTAWPSDSTGTLYTTDNGNDTVYKISGAFTKGSVMVAVTPCDANGAPSTCPAPGYPANYLGEPDPDTGVITAAHVRGPAVAAQGLLFLP